MLAQKQTVTLLSNSKLSLKFSRVITNQHTKTLNRLAKLLNHHHLTKDDSRGARLQNLAPLSIDDRTVVRQEIVSKLRSRSTDNIDSRDLSDTECGALAMLAALRDHSQQKEQQKQALQARPTFYKDG